MKFWIRINGVQEGPMEIDQMKQYEVTPTTYVWCAGMKDWAYARDVEVLAEVLDYRQSVANAEQKTEEDIEDAPINDDDAMVAEEDNTDDVELADDDACDDVVEDGEPLNDMDDADAVVEDEPKNVVVNAPRVNKQSAKKDDVPGCPPSNLVWSILATVLCCQITGIIAIVFAAQVSSKYNDGDYKTAKKYSEWSAWLVIASIVLFILWSSFAFPLMILGEM